MFPFSDSPTSHSKNPPHTFMRGLQYETDYTVEADFREWNHISEGQTVIFLEKWVKKSKKY